jgi:glycerol-3-phosphate dehydrogenase (NAD(P)+)
VRGHGCALAGFREVFVRLAPLLQDGSLRVSAGKGIEIESGQTMSQVMNAELAWLKRQESVFTGVLSGTSFADEVAKNQPTAVTVGFADLEVQELFAAHFLCAYTSTDIIGL